MSVFTCFECPISIQRVLISSLLLIAMGLALVSPLAANEACTFAEPVFAEPVFAETVAINSTIQKVRPTPHGTDLLRFDFPSPGMVALHASSTEGTPTIAFRGNDCLRGDHDETGQGYSIIRQTPIDLVLRIHTAGPYYLSVSAEDADVGLASYKLVTAFASDPVVPDEVVFLGTDPPKSCAAENLPSLSSTPFAGNRYVEIHRDARWTKDVDPIECDVLSGGSQSSGVLLFETEETPDNLLAFSKTATTDLIQATLFDGEQCVAEDRLAEGKLGGGSFLAAPIYGGQFRLDLLKAKHRAYSLGVKYFDLCGLTEQDDHLDWPLCSTHLTAGISIPGTLDNGLSDDEDFFTFKIPSQETVKIDVRGEGAVAVELYDGNGQRLALRDSCASEQDTGCGAHIVRTLGSDRYFVRVTGATSGPYSVTMARPEMP